MTAPSDQSDDTAPASGRLDALASRFDAGAPHPVRGPFTRWPRTTDGIIAVTVFAVSVLFVAASRLDDGDTFEADAIGDLPAGVFVLLALAAASLWWRRARPLAVTAFVLAVMIVWALAGYGDGHDLALIVAIYSVGRYCTDHRHSLAAVAAAFSVSILGSLTDTNQLVDVWPVILFTALPWYIGRRVRNRGDYLTLLQERAERLEAEQHARAHQAVAAERSRIARELHDVVAHQVSMMTVQAGAAKTIARADPDTAIDAMGDVERAGRAALGELRHLLGVLRHDADDPDVDHLGPPRGLDDIAALIDQLTRTGAHVTLTEADLPDQISAALDLSAYRIVQEAFTNIIKHAGPDPTVDVSLVVDDNTLAIDVANTTTIPGTTGTTGSTATAGSTGLPASGYGIAGMRERAALLGGTLTAGPQPPDRYRVHARLPLEPDPT